MRAEILEKFDFSNLIDGSIVYGADGVSLNFVCPCGCKGIGGVSWAPGRWTFHGTRASPTVQPSVFFCAGEPGEWHGWLRDGEWTSV